MDADEARISVLIVDDHRSFGEALGVALGKEADLDIVDVTADGESAVQAAEARQPNVALIDLQMPGMDGLETSRRIHGVSKETVVVVLTGADDELALGRAINAGAHGFLRKTAAVQDLAEAVRAAHRGDPLNAHDEIEFALRRLRRLRARDDDIAQRFDRLTPRELEILQLLADGCAPDDIATRLDVSRNTLRTHIQNILMKLGVHSKLDAIVAAIRHGRVTTVDVTDPVEISARADAGSRQRRRSGLTRLAVERVLALPPAILLQLEPFAVVHAVLDRVVVAPLALRARERDLRAVVTLRHQSFSLIAARTPSTKAGSSRRSFTTAQTSGQSAFGIPRYTRTAPSSARRSADVELGGRNSSRCLV